ncbi:MAG: sulfurtransferase TusA family protein [Sedimentisphaerales bacterium]|nr:sulfurtransferase TusA family protein [Sedimentisphaerales bacterium]
MANKLLDCKQLNCPMPIVKISQAMKEMSAGEKLEVEATDPAFGADLKAWVQQMRHELVEFSNGPVQRAVIRKGQAAKK